MLMADEARGASPSSSTSFSAQPVRSQEQLRRQMRGAGFDVTQATLSRDIRELGWSRAAPTVPTRRRPRRRPRHDAGRAGDVAARRWPRSCCASIACSSWCCCAPALAMRSRSARCSIPRGLPEVVGTLAGEDTILVITPDARRASALVKRLEEMSNPCI